MVSPTQPPEPQRLSKAQTEKAIDWLKEKCPHLNPKGVGCPACAGHSFMLDQELWEMRTFSGGGLFAAGSVWPLLVLTCNTCGHLMTFNAYRAGVIEPTAEALAFAKRKEGEFREDG